MQVITAPICSTNFEAVQCTMHSLGCPNALATQPQVFYNTKRPNPTDLQHRPRKILADKDVTPLIWPMRDRDRAPQPQSEWPSSERGRIREVSTEFVEACSTILSAYETLHQRFRQNIPSRRWCAEPRGLEVFLTRTLTIAAGPSRRYIPSSLAKQKTLLRDTQRLETPNANIQPPITSVERIRIVATICIDKLARPRTAARSSAPHLGLFRANCNSNAGPACIR